ncbi:MAG: hypothetical protein ABI972_16335 [Acidobacteriota bacterium]
MAFKMAVGWNKEKLPFIWNVSKHVGCKAENPNAATDVELVQFFLSEMVKSGELGRLAHGGVRTPPLRVTGMMDAVTAFWIFYVELGGDPAATHDGVVSPARGGIDYGVGYWAIAKMNIHFRRVFPEVWLNLDNDPRLTMALRTELKRTSP